MKQRLVLNLRDLPTYGFGTESPMWWGTLAFISLEATGFALAIGTYFYLAFIAQGWPISAPPPNIWPGTIVLVMLLVSVVPNHLVESWAKKEDLGKTQIGLTIMSIAGIMPLIVRIYEFPALGLSWDENAYGSILWLLLGLHTFHLLTDVGDTLVLMVLMFTRHGKSGRRFSDVSDNAFYWDFVVASWVVIYFVIYVFPRWQT